MYNFKS